MKARVRSSVCTGLISAAVGLAFVALSISFRTAQAAGYYNLGAFWRVNGISNAVTFAYSNAQKWNDYVKNDGTLPYNATNTTCAGSTETSSTACLHGGEIRKLVYKGTSCDGLTASDALNAFNWVCDASSGIATFYSIGLKSGVTLSSLIDFSAVAWKTNQLTVLDKGIKYSTVPARWWTNPVSAATISTTALVTLGTASTIYVINGNQNTTGFNITASKVGLVMSPDATVSFTGASTNSSCGTLKVAICVGTGFNYVWVEGSLDGATNTGVVGLYLKSMTFARIPSLSSRYFSSNGVYLTGATNSTFLSLVASNNGKSGLYLATTSTGNYFSTITAQSNGTATEAGVYLNSSGSNTFAGAINSSGNTGNGIYITGSANTSFSNTTIDPAITTSSNGAAGISITGSSSGTRFSGNIATYSNTGYGMVISSSGITVDGSVSSGMSGYPNGNGVYFSANSTVNGAITAAYNTGTGIVVSGTITISGTGSLAGNNNTTGISGFGAGSKMNVPIIANQNSGNGIVWGSIGTVATMASITANGNGLSGIQVNGGTSATVLPYTVTGDAVLNGNVGDGIKLTGDISPGGNGKFTFGNFTANYNGGHGLNCAGAAGYGCGTWTIGNATANGNAANGFNFTQGTTLIATSVTANNNRSATGGGLLIVTGYTSRIKIGSIFTNGNKYHGFYASSAMANSVVGSITANNNGARGVNISGSLGVSMIGPITAAYNGSGVYVNSGNTSGGTIFQGITAYNNGADGITLTGNYSTFSQLVSVSNTGYGISLGASYSKVFGNVIVSGNSTAACRSSGTSPGLTGTCAANNGSSFNLLTSANLGSTFVGRVSSDTANLSTNGGGTADYSTTLDLMNFQNLMRFFGPNTDTRGNCSSGTCQIWDYSLASSDTQLLNRSGNGSAYNNGGSAPASGTNSFSAGSDCPAEVAGTQYVQSAYFTYGASVPGIASAMSASTGLACASGNTDCYFTYLLNAVEKWGTGNGNNLCESGETCIYLPNFGSYQGHGDLGTCNFVAGAGPITGVTMQGYASNGR